MREAGHAARMGDMRNAHNIFVGKPEGKRTLGRYKRRWKDIRTDLRDIRMGRCGMDQCGSV
jgi:hypothetical protein